MINVNEEKFSIFRLTATPVSYKVSIIVEYDLFLPVAYVERWWYFLNTEGKEAPWLASMRRPLLVGTSQAVSTSEEHGREAEETMEKCWEGFVLIVLCTLAFSLTLDSVQYRKYHPSPSKSIQSSMIGIRHDSWIPIGFNLRLSMRKKKIGPSKGRYQSLGPTPTAKAR